APTQLLRACMVLTVLAAAVLWLGPVPVGAASIALLGLLFAPIFSVLIARTPRRPGPHQTAGAGRVLNAPAGRRGGAGTPALVGLLAARLGLEVVGACLLVAGLVQLGLYEALVRRAFAPRRSARSRIDVAVSSPPGG